MYINKVRWSKVYESTESELLGLIKSKKIDAKRMHLDQLDSVKYKPIKADLQWWCVDGSMIINTNSGALTVQAGDRVYIPAQFQFSLVAGLNGCTYYESK